MDIRKTLKKVIDKFLAEQPKLLVISPPRSGFTLLISILINLLQHKQWKRSPLRDELATFLPQASERLSNAIDEYFKKHINFDYLMISAAFKPLLGGPKWLNKENKDLCCVRKYIGIKGMGDFTLVISLPKVAMDFDPVIHSHYNPGLWLEDPYYSEYLKFSSIRNPLDIITSSIFSLNALTSEYIQRHLPLEDSMAIREKLGLYKLTDHNFLEGLVAYYIEYLNEFIKLEGEFKIMRFENLITEPEKTVQAIANAAGIDIPSKASGKIWANIGHRNLTGHHMHNLWKGRIGNWKDYLVNEHLEMLKSSGLNEILEDLGYEKIKFMDKKDYSPYQKEVAGYLSKGQIYRDFDDQDLFTFAFNKSNFRSSKYDFKQYPGRPGVEIERSTINNKDLLEGLADNVYKALIPINESLNVIHRRHASNE